MFQHCYRLICYWLGLAGVFSRSLFILWGFLVTSQPNQISFGGFSNKLIKPFSEKNKLSKWLPESTCFFHTADHNWNNWCSFDLPTHLALLLAYFMLTKFGSTLLHSFVSYMEKQQCLMVLFKIALLRDREELPRQPAGFKPMTSLSRGMRALSCIHCPVRPYHSMTHGTRPLRAMA